MDSEDADNSSDINNISLGREIMQAVKRNDLERPPTNHGRHVAFDSPSSEVSGAAFDDMDQYLNEALDEEESDDFVTPVGALILH